MHTRRRSICENISHGFQRITFNYLLPALKAAGFAYIVSETPLGLGARAYLNTTNTMNFLLDREDDRTSNAIVIPAITFGVISFVLAGLTRSRPTYSLFYPDQNEVSVHLDDTLPVISSAREIIGTAVTNTAKLCCTFTMLLTMGQTYASFSTIYEKFFKSDPSLPDNDFAQVLFCLQGTAAAPYPYWAFNIKPAFKNAEDLGQFLARGKLSDIKWDKIAYTFALTSFNLVGSFYSAYFGLQNAAPRIVGVRNILNGKVLDDVATFAASVNIVTSSIMMLRSVYANMNGNMVIELPQEHSPWVSTLTCRLTDNPWVLTKVLVYGAGMGDVVISGFLNSLTNTAKTLSKITRYPAHSPGVILLGCVTGAGGVIMAAPFMIQGAFKRMLPPKKPISLELREPLLEESYRIKINDRSVKPLLRIVSEAVPIKPLRERTQAGTLAKLNFITQARSKSKAKEKTLDILDSTSTPDISLSMSPL